MSDFADFSDEEIAVAERLDADVDHVLAGRVPPGAQHLGALAAAIRVDPPQHLLVRIERELTGEFEARDERRWAPFRVVAALLACLFLTHGIGNLVWGDWVADGVGESFSPHAVREGAFAVMAVGVVVAAGALYRRFASLAVVVALPVAVLFGVGGIAEIREFAPGAALHLSQGVTGVALAGTYWWLARDSAASRPEEKV